MALDENDITDFDIGIIGLGYVGLPIAIEFSKVTSVLGYDHNISLIESLRNGTDLNNEINFEQVKAAHNLSFHENVSSLEACNVYIVCVPTPVDDNNVPNLEYLTLACEEIGPFINDDDTIIFESTVFPGATEEICIPILENISGKTCLTDSLDDISGVFHVGYSPERINPGDKERKISEIVKVTSGSSLISQRIIMKIYKAIIKAGVHNAGAIRVAEAAKVLENIQRDVNIALMNEFANLFSKINIDTQEVINAAKTKWNFLHFTPGLVGGHCIGVDPYYLTNLANRENCDVELTRTARIINEAFPLKVAHRLVSALIKNEILPQKANILILGVTFKENVSDTRNSKVKELIEELEKWKITVFAHDPNVPSNIIEKHFTKNILENYNNGIFDAIVVAVGHDQFKLMSPSDINRLIKTGKQPIVFDLKSIFDKKTFIDSNIQIMHL